MSEIATQAKMMTVNPALRRSFKLKKGTIGTKDYVAPEVIIKSLLKHYKEDKDSYGVMGETGDDSYRIGRLVRWVQDEVKGERDMIEREIREYIKGLGKGWVIGDEKSFNSGNTYKDTMAKYAQPELEKKPTPTMGDVEEKYVEGGGQFKKAIKRVDKILAYFKEHKGLKKWDGYGWNGSGAYPNEHSDLFTEGEGLSQVANKYKDKWLAFMKEVEDKKLPKTSVVKWWENIKKDMESHI